MAGVAPVAAGAALLDILYLKNMSMTVLGDFKKSRKKLTLCGRN
jgi:hypothetical protein